MEATKATVLDAQRMLQVLKTGLLLIFVQFVIRKQVSILKIMGLRE